MASFLQFLLLFSLSVHLVFVSTSSTDDDQPSEIVAGPVSPLVPVTPIFRPTMLALKVQKDGATRLHVTNISRTTPPVQLPFVVDLNARFLSVNCESKYLSKTYNAPFCHSSQCSRIAHTCRTCIEAPPPRMPQPGCHVNACGVTAVNPVTKQTVTGELAEDVLSIPSTLGSILGQIVTVPKFLFACTPSVLLQKGLPKNVQGIAGLGHSQISLPYQLAAHFGIPPNIAICLASRAGQNGIVRFGDGPLMMSPGIDVTQKLTYAPLTIGDQGEYLINIQSIQIYNKVVPLPTTGRSNVAMLSTTTPYTILHQSIFTPLTQLFMKQLGVPQVAPVAPFGMCFDANKIPHSRMGPAVPTIHLVLDKKQKIRWSIFGQNAVVQARPGVMCLAMVNGGAYMKRTPIVIGAHQMEDNLVQLDLVNSKFGFSNSLLFQRTTCSNFNFTNNATP